MTSPTTHKFSPEVHDDAVRMVLEHEGEHPSRWAAMVSIVAKFSCSPHMLREWVRKVDPAAVVRKPRLRTWRRS